MLEGLTIIGQSLLVAALCFAAITLLASHLRYQSLARRSRDVREHGPAARTAFELQIVQRLGTAHRNPAPFTIARITPAGWALLRELHGAGPCAELMDVLGERLGASVRINDLVMPLQEDEVGVLIRASRTASVEVIKRVLTGLSARPVVLPSGLSMRVDVLAGLAAYPEDGDSAPVLYAKAAAALDRARADGKGWYWPESTVAGELPAAPAHVGETEDAASLLDALTGVLREDQLGSALQKFVAARRRDDLPVSVLVLDIDMLRRYNQQYGREVGDSLLRGMGTFLQKNTRERDLIARWHEDQFLIALDCPPALALTVAQRLWGDIRKASFGRSGLRLSVTVGVAGWPGHSGHARGLFEEAQLALRVGKSKGRNQCVLFNPEMRKLKVAAAPVEVF
ncbi:MAG TPA: diguanylate cyclase [Kiritimatiellia bacterium]|nr:diguanylate cyclase [Kiritimatiellia bacterium]